MSMKFDIMQTMLRAKDKYNLSEKDTAELYVDIIGDLEWDLDGVDYDSDDWQQQEHAVGMKELFNASITLIK